jgi:dTDP-glucose 4,6-dehydratase
LQRYDQIVNGTRHLLDLAVACGAQRFLLTSSGAVYGTQPVHLNSTPEDWHGMPDPLNPANSYGVAKRAAEHLCALYGQAHGLQTVVARCFAFSGADLPLDVHFAIGNFIRDALFHNEITVAGDGTAMRSYLDQSDLAHWLIALLDRGQSGEAFNVGSDQAISIADLATLVRDTLAPNKPIRILGTPDAQRPRHRYIPNTDKIQRHLGLRAATSLKESVQNTAQSARSRMNGEA